MKIIIGGGSGFVGRILIPNLIKSGNEIYVVGRDKNKLIKNFNNGIISLEWNDLHSLDAANFDAIINLTGANISEKRWNNTVKAELISSRTESTIKFIDWCKKSSGSKPHLYNASAVGYYGLQYALPDKGLFNSESTHINDVEKHGFSCRLVHAWEAAARMAEVENIPLTIMRFGVVLHSGEGMLKQLELPAKLGLSAMLGSGLQPISWIGSDDLVNAIQFLLAHPDIIGVVNFVAPEVVTQKKFSKLLASTMNRPAFLWLPAWLIKIMFGEMGEELLLSGQAVTSQCLIDNGFEFKCPTLRLALEHEYSRH